MGGAIHWLASYPKSGNTWMRILLTNYFRNDDVPARINELDGGPIAAARLVFDDNVGIETSDLTQDEIERLRPAVYETVSDAILARRAAAEADPARKDPSRKDVEMPPVLKVHDAYTRTVDGVPLLSEKATAGAIYLVRNPVDVVPSFAHHLGVTIDQAIGAMADDDRAFLSDPDRLHTQLRQRTLSWSGHVRSWVDEPGLARIVVRYEDLVDDTASQFAEVLQFLGVKPDAARVDRAVDFSAFDRLQAQEAEAAFHERPASASVFFRKGVVGDGEQTLTPEQISTVITDHREIMTRFRYLADST